MQFVINQAEAIDSASPRMPICNSHNFRFQIMAFGVPRGTVEPGTNISEMMAMMMMGASTLMTVANHTGTVSCSVKGNLEKLYVSASQP